MPGLPPYLLSGIIAVKEGEVIMAAYQETIEQFRKVVDQTIADDRARTPARRPFSGREARAWVSGLVFAHYDGTGSLDARFGPATRSELWGVATDEEQAVVGSPIGHLVVVSLVDEGVLRRKVHYNHSVGISVVRNLNAVEAEQALEWAVSPYENEAAAAELAQLLPAEEDELHRRFQQFEAASEELREQLREYGRTCHSGL